MAKTKLSKVEVAKKVFQENTNKFRDINLEVRENAIDYINKFLNENDRKIDDKDERGLLDGIKVIYCDDNHPEYGVGLSTIKSIYLDECGYMWFVLEENEVDVDQIETRDLIWIAEQIISLT